MAPACSCMMKNKLSPKARLNISRIIPFGLIWFVMSLIFWVLDFTMVGDYRNLPETAIKPDLGIMLFGTAAVTLIGLLVGTIELFYLNNRFAHKSFWRKIVGKTGFYLVLIFVVTFITFPIAASMELNTHLADPAVWQKLWGFLPSKTNLSTFIQLGTMTGLSLFYAEISEYMGHRVLTNFFTGKYHQPKEEHRIFMFSDMKSSTRIAEQIGHARYYELLRAYYNDLSDGIVNYAGEIYQYVGDEVIVSWPAAVGLKKQNCLRSFYAMKADLQKKADWYQEHFGLVPDFKAGFHIGTVTTGEIGALKKEIIFTGDVLNATARIQELCNHFRVDLLVSEDLLRLLESYPGKEIRSVGQCELRGRQQTLELYTLSATGDAQ